MVLYKLQKGGLKKVRLMAKSFAVRCPPSPTRVVVGCAADFADFKTDFPLPK